MYQFRSNVQDWRDNLRLMGQRGCRGYLLEIGLCYPRP